MKLASIVPINDIEKTYDGQFAMLLAHLKDYYPKCYNNRCYRIMDNSLIELKGAVTIEEVVKAARQCNVDEIILPDVFRNGFATVKTVEKSIKWLKDRNVRDFKLMAVCQGATISEFEKCFYELEKIPEIHCIGIPKVSTTLNVRGRPYFEYLWTDSPKTIHLLGCWETLAELLEYRYPQRIRSVDTCIPALLSKTTDIAWVKRPNETIDLINDKINVDRYYKIVEQLTMAGIL